MIDSRDAQDPEVPYKFWEQRPDALLEMTFLADNEVAHVIKLPGSNSSLTWEHKLTPESRAACRQALQTMANSGKSLTEGATFKLATSLKSGTREVASWNSSNEEGNLGEARQTLESQGHALYVVALAYLKQGDAKAALDHHAAALSYKAGLEALGKSYVDTKVMDDSGMHLVLAKSTESKEGIARASGMYRGILDTRLSILANRDHLKDAVIK